MAAERLLHQEAAESLRQCRKTFDQAHEHRGRQNTLELVMGYVAVAALPCLIALTAYLLTSHSLRPAAEAIAASALVTETVGAIAMVWRFVLNKTATEQAIPPADAPRPASEVLRLSRRPKTKR
jgi:hypothetical protein